MKRKGFTLVELVIVIVIVGILSIVAVPIYRGYTRKAMGTEAKSLLGAIQTAEKVYYAEMSEYLVTTGKVSFEQTLDVDARANKYFTGYTISKTTLEGEDAFLATVEGEDGTPAKGITMKLTAGVNGKPVWEDSGLN